MSVIFVLIFVSILNVLVHYGIKAYKSIAVYIPKWLDNYRLYKSPYIFGLVNLFCIVGIFFATHYLHHMA